MTHQKLHSNRSHSRHFYLILSFTAVFLLAFSLAGCGDSSSGPGTNGNGNGNGNNEPGPNEVQMVGNSFSPADITVDVGTTVTWTNESSVIHTVTSGSDGEADGLFNSGNVSPGQTYEYTFTEAGTYDYFCIPHAPNMRGTVTVTSD